MSNDKHGYLLFGKPFIIIEIFFVFFTGVMIIDMVKIFLVQIDYYNEIAYTIYAALFFIALTKFTVMRFVYFLKLVNKNAEEKK